MREKQQIISFYHSIQIKMITFQLIREKLLTTKFQVELKTLVTK